MASKKFSQVMKRSALSVALGMCFVAGVQAQSNTAGAVVVQASAGDVIVIENPATGFKREVTVGADGSIRVPSLAIGSYTIKRGGDSRTVNVSVGTSTAVSFAQAASTLEAIEVRGVVNPIDVSSVESNTILTKQQIDSLPVARNVTNVALLAPGTTAGDSDFGNFASFGGSSVSENAYFINGFNVTNFRTGLGFSNVPFDMYQEFQVKTGGYGAEFGRSTGGVINAVTKRGSNEWHFGINAFWEPDTSENGPDVFWQNPTDADGNPRDPLVRSVRSRDKVENFTTNVYASGPIVEDRLFFYAIAQQRDLKTDNYTANTLEKIRNDDPFYGLKLDWAITDSHYLEYTGFRDRSNETTEVFAYDYNNDEVGASGGGGAFVAAGGDNHILKYTGYLTDTFTLSALAGRGKMSQTAGSPSDLCPAIYDGRSGSLVARGCWNEAAFQVESGEDERTAYRLDGEWILGDHQLRFGLDREETVSNSTLSYSGGIYYRYYNVPGSGTVAGYGPVPAGTNFLTRVRVYAIDGSFNTYSNAYYLEDNWQLTDNLLLNLGIRNEGFDNRNGANETFIDIADQWAPRLGFSWDANGDASLKVFGNAGRYFLPIPSNTNIRMAGGELFTEAWYATSALNADDTPVLGAQIGSTNVFSAGIPAETGTLINKDIKPMYQDEYILGFQREMGNNWSVGVRAIYRDLKSSIEDVVIDQALNEYAYANGFAAPGSEPFTGEFHYVLTNPGEDIRTEWDIDGDGDLDEVELTAEWLGYPQAKRNYKAIEVFFERAFDGVWFLQGSYTLSKSYGNSEGGVRSDNDQDDSGITTQFDSPGLTDGATGYLPNDRRHRLKVFGAWQVNEEWQLGSNVLVESGRPRNCFGFYPGTDPVAAAYGADSFYCNGVLNPRGSRGRNPWTWTVDASVEYRPNMFENKLGLKLDVFNLFNRQSVVQIDEIGELDSGSENDGWGMPVQFQSARSVRLSVSYDW